MSQKPQRHSAELPRAVAAVPWSCSNKIAPSDWLGALAVEVKFAMEVVGLAILLCLAMLLLTGCASAVVGEDAGPFLQALHVINENLL
jgi:hypothetical protein